MSHIFCTVGYADIEGLFQSYTIVFRKLPGGSRQTECESLLLDLLLDKPVLIISLLTAAHISS